MRLSLEEVIANARRSGPARLFPRLDDPRVRHGAVFSEIWPRFCLSSGTSVFTIGSCFSRSVEERLPGFRVPTLDLAVPSGERPGRPNGVLNEYNPGTICQRLELAASGGSFGDLCIAPDAGGFLDLLLPDHVAPCSTERLLQRRAQVDRVYAALPGCEAVIMTFDLVEAWYDKEAGLYLNRLPPAAFLMAERDRFELHVLDFEETERLFERSLAAIRSLGVKKVILIVSPVPLEGTYAGQDSIVANSFSKSVLLVCADRLCRNHPDVDYFPGYEIVMSAGPASYEADSIHVRDEVVDFVTSYLVERYVGEGGSA
ncbi:MAG: hypothetical protein QOD93_7411 [Acetobacteraceae bacterium]|jgi:hypothetical protein|nr:hypothetical protein [Acetobacteraceae bacterium]MEA2774449.1 hypothetical protein [Acetobacteraceae bacterium]